MAHADHCNSPDKSLNEDTKKDEVDLKSLIEQFNKRRLKVRSEKDSLLCLDEQNTKIPKTFATNVLNKMNAESELNSNYLKTVNASSELELPVEGENMQSSHELNSLFSSFMPSNLDELEEISDSEDLLCAISKKKDENSCDSDENEDIIVQFSTQLQKSDPKPVIFKDLSLWEKQKIPALQIGVGIPKPVFCVEETRFSKHVLQILKDIKFFGPSCIQSVVWPTVDRGRSMVVIAPPHSGKTVSYVIPLVSRSIAGEISKENEGPISIILCSSWKKAQAVHDYFDLFLGDFKIKLVTLCTKGGTIKNKIVSLINKCDILIATPHCLFKFLEEKTISFAQLEEFILDDGSTIIDKHKHELKEILLCLMEARNRGECSFQLMICAERWNKNFEIIIDKVMSSPLIYFTSFLEAAVYAKVSMSVHISTTKGEKKMTLIKLVKNAGKVVICTTNATDAVEVHHFLKKFHSKSYLVNEEMEHYLTNDIIKNWKSDTCETHSSCLIITDQCLADMCISNANCLIHFDIPSKSRLQFGNRFSCIAEHFTEKEVSNKCMSHILIMEAEYCFAPHLVEIIENIGGTPSEQLIELSKKQSEHVVSSQDLCHYMKAFGCCKLQQCKSRHIIDSAIDKPQVVPCEGDIHGLVTHIIEANHYYIRVLKYLDPVLNETVSFIVTHAAIGFQLKDFYSCASDEMKVKTPEVGENYILEGETKLFFRIKVLEFFPETLTQLAQWKILYLDEGWIKYHKKLNLYKVSNQIQLPEPLAVEVYLCNIRTPDSCLDWNPQTSLLVSDLIKGKEIHGKIVLCIGRSLFLEPLAVAQRLPNGLYAYPFKVNQKLLDCGHALINKKHIKLLYEACDRKIPLPRFTKSKKKEEKIIVEEKSSINYAFLECNEFEDVYVSSVVSPNQLYVQRAKFVECLDDLLDKINLEVKDGKLKRAYNIYENMFCIAPFHEDNRYYRAKVTEIISCDEVQLFFVDFGDTGKVLRKDLYCLPAEFMLLPIQAIECELVGVTAPHGGWCESAANKLAALTRDNAYDMKILLLKAYHKSNSYYDGNHYEIDLWDDGKKISELLLQAGYGIQVDISNTSSAEILSDNSTSQTNQQALNLNDKCSTSSENEDLDPEDKDIQAQFYGTLARMVAENCNIDPKPATVTEVSSDDEEILKKYKAANVSVSNNKSIFSEKHPFELTEIKTKELSEPSLSSMKPLITWWDTPEELNVLINLKDIKLYQLDVNNEGFTFSTIIAGVQYSTEEKFYENINSQDATTYQSIQGINIIAKKYTPFKWPRFTMEKKRYFHIKYDLIHIDDSDNEETETRDKDRERLRYLYDDIDKNESSTDEDEKYVEPWKEFAQSKDIYNRLL